MKLLLETLKLLREAGPWNTRVGICGNVDHISGRECVYELHRVFIKMKKQGLVRSATYPVSGAHGKYFEDFYNGTLWKDENRLKLLNQTIEFIENSLAKETLWTRLLRFLRLS